MACFRFEGVAMLMQGRGQRQLVLVIVLAEVLFFLLENNHKYSFFTPDNKVMYDLELGAWQVPRVKLITFATTGLYPELLHSVSYPSNSFCDRSVLMMSSHLCLGTCNSPPIEVLYSKLDIYFLFQPS
jgi:hypothetical protein